jgi:predicted alpha/beta-hydrolase family hydrolase
MQAELDRWQVPALHSRAVPLISAHIAGVPVEETLLYAGPAVLTAAGVALARVQAWVAARRRGVEVISPD